MLFIKKLVTFDHILELFDLNFYVGFDVLRYNSNELAEIVKILIFEKGFINKMLFSNGVEYRTDLKKYGGKGFFAVFDFLIKEVGLSQE